jgi:hypothetical protein
MKTIEELRQAIEAIFQAGINIHVYLGVNSEEGTNYSRADLDDNSARSVCEEFVSSIRRYFANEDLVVHTLSQIDNRDNAIWHYDLQTVPDAFAGLSALPTRDNIPVFSFEHSSIADVKTVSIKISSAAASVLFFKQLYPVSLIKQDQILLFKVGDRFQQVPGDVLKITGGFDLLIIDDEFYISNFKKFEKSFNFDDVSNRIHRATAARIIGLGIVNDAKSYLANGHAPKRDLLRVAHSEVLQLPIERILAFANSRVELALKIVDGQIQLKSKEHVKRFIKLLNDDYLKSELTENNYDSLAKNKMTANITR